MEVTLRSYTPNPVETIELAASNCYDSIPKTKGKIMEHCINSGHLSVCEFAQFHFHIEEVSRTLLTQLTRHRTGKYAVRSQRYCSEDGFKFVTPPSILRDDMTLEEYRNLMNRISWFYDFAKGRGIPNEDARFVLPNACETVIDVSFDFRNLMHFMNERLCNKAQWEIQELAKKMRECVVEVEPVLTQWLVPKCKMFGKCLESKPCGKEVL